MEESGDVVDGVEVFWDELFVLYADVEFLFQVGDEFENAGGVDDAFFEEGGVVGQAFVVAEEEVLCDEGFDGLFDFGHFLAPGF